MFGVNLAGLNVYGNTLFNGSPFTDQVFVEGCSFGGRVMINLGKGDDRLDLVVNDSSRFNSSVVVNFGLGDDTLEDNGANYYAIGMITLGGPETIL
jgi:hypothetical protein